MIVRNLLWDVSKLLFRPRSHRFSLNLHQPGIFLSKIQPRQFCSDTEEEDPEDKNYHSLISRFLPGAKSHNLLVLQPYVKWGWKKRRDTTAELQLEEAVALVSTLRRWNVVDQLIVPLENLEKHEVFGKGKLEELQERVKKNKKITAIFISTKIMTTEQKLDMERIFRLPIYDRYSIVIQIFKENAVTKHAKLQVALAELPYVRNLLSSEGHLAASMGMSQEAIRLTLHTREAKLRAEMKKCQIYHHTLEKNRLQRKIPLVAVVGYTNAGKTSIIKALTGEKKLEPKNSLFATLDVTMHEGYLPSRLKVIYVDTVGFMSDLPDTLLDCFVATLEHVAYADAIVHVCDGSHPDLALQREHTMKTLGSFKHMAPGFLDRVITVRNKCDKIPEDSDFQDDLPVSAKSGQGMKFLEQIIEAIIVKTTNRQMMVLRVPSGGEEAKWLYKETAVCDVEADPEDGQFLRFKVLLSDIQLARFKSYFLKGRRTG